ncbi:MAG TPA: LytTR family DNA-binding domain-containing protein [Arachidicoccus sp.]
MQKEAIKCVIAETDILSANNLSDLIGHFPQYNIEAIFTNAKDLTDYLNKYPTDIAFVNIDLPELNGYGFLQGLKSHPETIIVSSKNDLAVEGYDYGISNFLLKPVSLTKLLNAVKKTEATISAKKTLTVQRPPHHQFLFIRAEYKLMKINFKDILYIEGLKDYSKIYTASSSGKAIITLQNLKSFEEKLSADDFIRVHRSYIVSLSKVDMIHKSSILIGKNEIPISDGFKSHLHSIISKYT